MTALAIFAAVTTTLAPLLRLRAHLRPHPYDAPVWCWRLRLAWRAHRRAHGRTHPRQAPRRARRPARPARRPNYVRRHPGPRTGRRLPVLDLTVAQQSADRERW